MQNLDENFHRQNQEKKNQNQFLRQIPTEGGTPTVVVVVGGWVEGGGGGGGGSKS